MNFSVKSIFTNPCILNKCPVRKIGSRKKEKDMKGWQKLCLGRKQVNKALHTCTSWYAYAAMFGSSTDMMGPRAHQLMYRFVWGGGGSRPWQAGEARSPEGTREIFQNQGSELFNATVVPQSHVVTDLTCCEDKLNLTTENAARTATPVGIPECYWSTRKTAG